VGRKRERGGARGGREGREKRERGKNSSTLIHHTLELD
jgi:hypothetical protein